MAKKKDKPRERTVTRQERGAGVVQLMTVLRLLAEKPIRPTDLKDELACSRRTVERLLHGIEAAGLTLEVDRSGRDAYYSLKPQAVRQALGV